VDGGLFIGPAAMGYVGYHLGAAGNVFGGLTGTAAGRSALSALRAPGRRWKWCREDRL